MSESIQKAVEGFKYVAQHFTNTYDVADHITSSSITLTIDCFIIEDIPA